MTEREFPFHPADVKNGDGPTSIHWSLIEPHERQAQSNHDQTLRRLAERGGLSYVEAYLVMNDLPMRDFRKIKREQAIQYLNGVIASPPCGEEKNTDAE